MERSIELTLVLLLALTTIVLTLIIIHDADHHTPISIGDTHHAQSVRQPDDHHQTLQTRLHLRVILYGDIKRDFSCITVLRSHVQCDVDSAIVDTRCS